MTMRSDLTWYFQEAAPYLGYSSSYRSFQFRLEGGTPTPSTDPIQLDDKTVRQIKKFNRIHSTLLHKFTSQQRAMLNGLFNKEVRIPFLLTSIFGELAGIAIFDHRLKDLLYVAEYQSGYQLRAHKDYALVNKIKADSKKIFETLQSIYEAPKGTL